MRKFQYLLKIFLFLVVFSLFCKAAEVKTNSTCSKHVPRDKLIPVNNKDVKNSLIGNWEEVLTSSIFMYKDPKNPEVKKVSRKYYLKVKKDTVRLTMFGMDMGVYNWKLFRIKKSKKFIVSAWEQKESENSSLLFEASINKAMIRFHCSINNVKTFGKVKK